MIPILVSEDVPPDTVLVVGPTTIIACPNSCPPGTRVVQCAAAGRSGVICACTRCRYVWEIAQ